MLTTGIVHREVKIYTRFFLISNTFISNVRLKLTKARQHPEAELLLFENYLLSSSSLSFKNNKRYSKKCTKKQVRLFKWGYIINGNEKRLKTKIDDIDTTWTDLELDMDTNLLNIKYISVLWWLCILSNT